MFVWLRHSDVRSGSADYSLWLSQMEEKKANPASTTAADLPQQLVYKTASVPRVSFANDAGTLFLRQLQVLDRDVGSYQGETLTTTCLDACSEKDVMRDCSGAVGHVTARTPSSAGGAGA